MQDIRDRLLHMADVSQEKGWECVLMQGSGTFTVESVVTSVVPRDGGKLLVASNGAYGDRMAQMAKLAGIDYKLIKYTETQAPSAADIAAELKGADGPFSHVGVIHHETTAGTLNPVEEIGQAIKVPVLSLRCASSALRARDMQCSACQRASCSSAPRPTPPRPPPGMHLCGTLD